MGLEEALHACLAEVSRAKLVVLAVDAGVGQHESVGPLDTLENKQKFFSLYSQG